MPLKQPGVFGVRRSEACRDRIRILGPGRGVFGVRRSEACRDMMVAPCAASKVFGVRRSEACRDRTGFAVIEGAVFGVRRSEACWDRSPIGGFALGLRCETEACRRQRQTGAQPLLCLSTSLIKRGDARFALVANRCTVRSAYSHSHDATHGRQKQRTHLWDYRRLP